eukprot:CAMPEP_0116893010 /NCGR_PEP_ID=MMETSP0467-20121206/3098_1 /TAXON_ID=283647 /ORGANISM="Mesodinium pulex, Strain SPMC105" /LENGTH=84 /DNA_ID=CAMNT_0004562441 /DNA_START=418 /DNA_END=672 /DNA_ORIENTATION=-
MVQADEEVLNKTVPLLVTHGKQDQMVNFKKALESYKNLESKREPFEQLYVEGLGHSIDHSVLRSIWKFLDRNDNEYDRKKSKEL